MQRLAFLHPFVFCMELTGVSPRSAGQVYCQAWLSKLRKIMVLYYHEQGGGLRGKHRRKWNPPKTDLYVEIIHPDAATTERLRCTKDDKLINLRKC